MLDRQILASAKRKLEAAKKVQKVSLKADILREAIELLNGWHGSPGDPEANEAALELANETRALLRATRAKFSKINEDKYE